MNVYSKKLLVIWRLLTISSKSPGSKFFCLVRIPREMAEAQTLVSFPARPDKAPLHFRAGGAPALAEQCY